MRAALQAHRVLSAAARRAPCASALPACRAGALRDARGAAALAFSSIRQTRDLACRFKSSDAPDGASGTVKPQDHQPGEDALARQGDAQQPASTSGGAGGVPWVPLLCVPVVVLALAATGGDFWSFYLRMLQEYPFSSRIATGMTGVFLGDLLAQMFPPLMARLRPPSPSAPVPSWSYDVPRAVRLVLFSALLGTPVAYYWYTFLDAVINPLQPTAVSTVATKVALDQLLLTPIMTTAFFVAMCTMEGRAYAAVDAVRTKLIPTLKANYMLWPAAHCINFAFIPGDQRILYINCVAVLWTVVLSTAAAAPMGDSSTAGGGGAAAGGGGDTVPRRASTPLVGRDDMGDSDEPRGGGAALQPVALTVNARLPGGKKLQ